MIGATGLLLGIALAMYRRVDADKRQNYRSMFVSTVLAVFLTGVTEPLEFMFMFCALPLYRSIRRSAGLCAFAHGRYYPPAAPFLRKSGVHYPYSDVRKSRSGRRSLSTLLSAWWYFSSSATWIAYVMIGKFRFATPGRLGNYTDEGSAGRGESEHGRTQCTRRQEWQQPGRTHHRVCLAEGRILCW